MRADEWFKRFRLHFVANSISCVPTTLAELRDLSFRHRNVEIWIMSLTPDLERVSYVIPPEICKALPLYVETLWLGMGLGGGRLHTLDCLKGLPHALTLKLRSLAIGSLDGLKQIGPARVELTDCLPGADCGLLQLTSLASLKVLASDEVYLAHKRTYDGLAMLVEAVKHRWEVPEVVENLHEMGLAHYARF